MENVIKHPFQCLASTDRLGGAERSAVVLACKNRLLLWDWESNQVTANWEDSGSKEKASIIKVSISPDGKSVVLVTGEDKCVHVLDSSTLKHLSRRQMPKRPCAFAFVPGRKEILTADKAGDVYALPLQPKDDQVLPDDATSAPRKSYKPAASELTVHSAKNRRALQTQQKVAANGQQTQPAKESQYQPILGHISMLTDIKSVQVMYNRAGSGYIVPASDRYMTRTYILTADRDEHIRISRGMPDPHIIENYCLGHDQFITKLCLLVPDLLISGGGDPYLCLWSWLEGRLVCKIDLPGDLAAKSQPEDPDASEQTKPSAVVSGLWAVFTDIPKISRTDFSQSPGSGSFRFLVTCEGVPSVHELTMSFDNGNLHTPRCEWHTHKLRGNPLDLAIVKDNHVVVAVDNVCNGETLDMAGLNQRSYRIEVLELNPDRDREGSWLHRQEQSQRDWFDDHLSTDDSVETALVKDDADLKRLRDLLYGLGNLRKREYEDLE